MGHSKGGAELHFEDGRSMQFVRTELWTMLGLVGVVDCSTMLSIGLQEVWFVLFRIVWETLVIRRCPLCI